MQNSIFEILFLLCFSVSWPVSIYKSLRTKIVRGKSPMFMAIVMLGYVFGVIHKLLYSYDYVTFLYILNFSLVGFDLILYFRYRHND